MFYIYDSEACAYADDIIISKAPMKFDDYENAEFVGKSDTLLEAVRIANEYLFNTQKYIDIYYGGYEADDYDDCTVFKDHHKKFNYVGVSDKELDELNWG